MRIGFFVFVIIAAVIITSAHAGLYYSLVKFFQIEVGPLRQSLYYFFVPLSFSFLATALLVHWHENVVIRFAYMISSVWLGLFLYLLMTTALCWLIFLLIKLSGIELSSSYFAAPLYVAAILFSAYAVWNAENPVLRTVNVKIAGLPEQWKGRTIVQASDIHVGAINRAGFAQKVADLINRAHPDAVMITGDLFDGTGENLNHLVEPLNQIKAPLGMYFITGNHETYVGLQKSFDALRDINLKILRDEIVDLDGIQLVGIDYLTIGRRERLDSILTRIDRTRPSIVLFHEPRFVDLMKRAGVNLQLAGHTHRGQMWPFNYITRRVYDGLDYGLHTDGDYNLYTSCGTGTWGPPLRTGNRPEVVAFKLE